MDNKTSSVTALLLLCHYKFVDRKYCELTANKLIDDLATANKQAQK